MTETVYVEGSGHECDVKLDTWLKDLLPRTPGLVRKVARRELILAAREFYERSCAWRVVIGPKALRAGKARYRLSPYDAYANVVYVQNATVNGVPLRRMATMPTRQLPGSETSWGYFLDGTDTIILWPTPRGELDAELVVYAALTPKQSVTHLPQMAATHHYDALLDGVLGRLYAHPAKPYSDPTRAQYHLQRFRAAIGSFAGLAKQGHANAQAWVFPTFGM